MRLAVLTDIHANRAALEAVLADAATRGCDRTAVLGDIVGYGPDPGWCTDRVADLVEHGAICLKGNHDDAATGAAMAMNPIAARAIDWTRDHLTPAQRDFLAVLPLTAELPDLFLVHASADRPAAWHYITDPEDAAPSFRATPARLILAGHVHVPLLVSRTPSGTLRAQPFRTGTPQPLDRAHRWLAVVGSVGQPRDGDSAASYAILDTTADTLTYHKVPYDAAATAAKIRAAGLPAFLAERLLDGI